MGRPLRALIVEDSEDDAALLVRELRRGGYDVTVERVDTPEGLEDALERGGWDIVFADYTMPRFRGTAALEIVRDRTLDLPFIFVSGTIGEDMAVEAIKAGANDYVIKGNLKRLLPTVARELRDAAARRERKQLEAQLLQAQRLESVGRLAGGIAHDFNNLLTAVMGYADLLLAGPALPRGQREDVEEIKRAAERGASLTRQLLAFSRRQILELRVLDLNAVVADMEQMLRRLLGEDVELVTRVGTNLGRIRADFGQLQQVLLNLAVNARDAMPEGGILTVETANAEVEQAFTAGELSVAAGRYVVVSVSDTGIGMDAETQTHIFDPFFTTKEPGKGTGLGLATVFGVVIQSGGRIWVDSAPRKGTTFTIYLPQVDEPAEPLAPEEDAGSLPTGTETILVVEDDDAVREVAARVLRRQGYTVLEAARGEDVLRWLGAREWRIDLLLTDAVLPGMTGRELAERAAALRPGIKVLYTSGYANVTLAPQGILEPGVILVRKPFPTTALARKVREVLDSG